jgi:hypothetical protein
LYTVVRQTAPTSTSSAGPSDAQSLDASDAQSPDASDAQSPDGAPAADEPVDADRPDAEPPDPERSDAVDAVRSAPRAGDRSEALIELLANARRRYLWQHLRREGREVPLNEASRAIAARELDKAPADVTYDERKSVYTSLLQFHCPKMAEAGLVAFDRRAATVAPCEGTDLVVEVEPDRRRVAATVVAAVGLSTLVTVGAWRLGLPVFGALSLRGLAVSLGVATAVACALYYSAVRSARVVDLGTVLARLR